MSTITDSARPVTGGVDTHREFHVAAVVDDLGRIIGTETFPATSSGYRSLLAWMRRHGQLTRVGVEGTGAYGAGLARFLTAEDVVVLEVNRPDRSARRVQGKSDPVDAQAAARAALAGVRVAVPKTHDGPVEAIRMLRVCRRSAVRARTQCANQIHNMVVTAPDDLRARWRDVSITKLSAEAVRLRPGADLADPTTATKHAMVSLARRWQQLDLEVRELDIKLGALVKATAPTLCAVHGVGTDTAGALLVAAGDNPGRLTSEAAFAALCGVSPVQASSGRVQRHRLNRGGDRQANNALWRIVLVRMSTDPRTRAYVERRTKEGRSKKEIIRCLKRYIARELYPLITLRDHQQTPEDKI
jgi:transposase